MGLGNMAFRSVRYPVEEFRSTHRRGLQDWNKARLGCAHGLRLISWNVPLAAASVPAAIMRRNVRNVSWPLRTELAGCRHETICICEWTRNYVVCPQSIVDDRNVSRRGALP